MITGSSRKPPPDTESAFKAVGSNCSWRSKLWTGSAAETPLLALAVAGCEEAKDADVNADGYVDILDAGLVASCMMMASPPADPRREHADVDGNGTVDERDLAVAYHNFGEILFRPLWPAFEPSRRPRTRRPG